jgi:hypothetical protein
MFTAAQWFDAHPEHALSLLSPAELEALASVAVSNSKAAHLGADKVVTIDKTIVLVNYLGCSVSIRVRLRLINRIAVALTHTSLAACWLRRPHFRRVHHSVIPYFAAPVRFTHHQERSHAPGHRERSRRPSADRSPETRHH